MEQTSDHEGGRAPEPDKRALYYQRVGEFVLEFAATEKTMLAVLIFMSEVKPAVAKSIFSGVRIDTIKDYINRIIAAEAAKGSTIDHSLLTEALDHLGHITRVRNDLLHYGLDFGEGVESPKVSTHLFAHIPQRGREYSVSVQDLGDMIIDMLRMLYRVVIHLSPPGTEIPESVSRAARAPWRYKPRGQSAPPKRLPSPNPARINRPSPSQA